MAEPIGVRPGTYPIPGQVDPVMGLCIVLDDAEANWEVAENRTDYSITITIPPTSPWRVNRAEDTDKPGSYYLQVFRVGGNIDSIELQNFDRSTNAVHTPNAHPPDGETSELKIHYSSPEISANLANNVYEARTVAEQSVK